MKLSKLALSSLLFVAFYLFIVTSYPKLFEETNQEKCCISFFIIGICAIVIYNLVDSIYK